MPGPLPAGDEAPRDGRLPDQARSGAENRTLHAYLHIPFCAARCGYCDFNTYTASELPGFNRDSYPQVIEHEIALAARVLADFPARELASVFFGGGTPTLLPASDLVSVLKRLSEHFPMRDGVEVTTEANPDSVTAEYLESLAAGGFTRVSFGMQSAVTSTLAVLDRTHDPAKLPEVVAWAKRAGLATSVDLIYGSPGETLQDWERSLEAALALETDHISAYSLIVEPGTRLARQIESGRVQAPSDDLAAEMYELGNQRLSEAGFENYEISNFARGAEQRSRHNLAYWRSQDWWGFGPGAHSHFGGVRWWNQKHPSSYAKLLESGESPAAAREVLTPETRALERVMLELRTREGLPAEVLLRHNPDAKRMIAEQIAAGNLDGRAALGGSLVLTERGRLMADAVVRSLVG